MNIQVFVFNYNLFNRAVNIFDTFNDLGYDTYILNCAAPSDPPFSPTPKVLKLPNIYYSGQWNKCLELATGDVIFIISSDITVPNPRFLMRRMNYFYRKYEGRAAVYAPNVHWTPWTYNPHLLPELEKGLKIVPGPDSMVWSLRTALAHKVGPMDLSINRIGWGIELLAAYMANKDGDFVVRDYQMKCHHPQSSAYNRHTADNEFRNMIKKMKLDRSFWDFYNSRDKYHFGWHGDYMVDPITLL